MPATVTRAGAPVNVNYQLSIVHWLLPYSIVKERPNRQKTSSGYRSRYVIGHCDFRYAGSLQMRLWIELWTAGILPALDATSRWIPLASRQPFWTPTLHESRTPVQLLRGAKSLIKSKEGGATAGGRQMEVCHADICAVCMAQMSACFALARWPVFGLLTRTWPMLQAGCLRYDALARRGSIVPFGCWPSVNRG